VSNRVGTVSDEAWHLCPPVYGILSTVSFRSLTYHAIDVKLCDRYMHVCVAIDAYYVIDIDDLIDACDAIM
jgi:hypothetical protein